MIEKKDNSAFEQSIPQKIENKINAHNSLSADVLKILPDSLEKSDIEAKIHEANRFLPKSHPTYVLEAKIPDKIVNRARVDAALIANAKSFVAQGKYVPEFFFAGAGTRMGAGAFYFIDPAGIAKDILGKKGTSYKKYQSLNAKERSLIEMSIREFYDSEKDNLSLALGPRELLQFAASVMTYGRESGIDEPEALRSQKMIIHINDQVNPETSKPYCDEIITDFIKRGFFGFDPKKVVFLIQPAFRAYRIRKQSTTNIIIEEVPNSEELVYGHGYATCQMARVEDAFVVLGNDPNVRRDITNDQGEVVDALSYIQLLGGEILGTHRINDLTKLDSDRAFDPVRIATQLEFIRDGHNVVVELVDNPTGQKGGHWMGFQKSVYKEFEEDYSESFLLEGVNTKTNAYQELFDRQINSGYPESFINRFMSFMDQTNQVSLKAHDIKGLPYNAFRLAYSIEGVKNILKTYELPYNLRYKFGCLYLESVTGDISQFRESRSASFVLADEDWHMELIHDFKEMKNLSEALLAIKKQNHDADFRKVTVASLKTK